MLNQTWKVFLLANESLTLIAALWLTRFQVADKYILKGKRNAYFEFLNVGFILRTLFFLISATYTH